MNENIMVEMIKNFAFTYNILLCCTLAVMVLMAWKLNRAEKAIKDLQAKCVVPEAPCSTCGAKQDEPCDAGLHG